LCSSGDSPEVIGEASILVARTCFSNDDLGGDNGHTKANVVCKLLFSISSGRGHQLFSFIDILFGNQVPAGVGDKTINIGNLKTLGDQQAKKLADALKA
jgi:hypothetical protein